MTKINDYVTRPSRRIGPVAVEFTAPDGSRQVKEFHGQQAARRFYATKLAEGAQPKVNVLER